jgi:hypothetical protein
MISAAIQQRRQQEFDAAGTRAEVDQLIQRWQREDTELKCTETSQAKQISALEARVRHLEQVLLSENRCGLSDGVVDTIAMAMDTMRRRIEQKIPKFCGPHEAGRTYEPHSFVIKGGSLWISLVRTVKPPGTEDWQLVTKQGEVR